MKRPKKPRGRRRDHHWSSPEIDQLVELGLLGFVPRAPQKALKRLSIIAQREVIKQTTASLPEDIRAQIDGELKNFEHWTKRPPPVEDLPRTLLDIAERCTAGTPSFALLRMVYTYVAARMGYAAERALREVTGDACLSDRRWQSLSIIDQKLLFLDWTELYEHIWNDLSWRECLRMRYASGDRPAIEHIPHHLRVELEEEATEFRRSRGAIQLADNELDAIIAAATRGEQRGHVYHVLLVEYLRALIEGEIGPDHWSRKPISASGFFERIPEHGLGFDKLHEKLQENFPTRFCRYLIAPEDHSDALLGRILYYLTLLDWEIWQQPPELPPELPGIRWSQWTFPGRDQPTQDFQVISEAFTASLGIRSGVFDQIWNVQSDLRLRRDWESWASSDHTAYWAARLLESIDPEVYRSYGRTIDEFHLDVLRPLMRMQPEERLVRIQPGSPLDAFARRCTFDPLLNCMFHSEVLDGRKALLQRATGSRRDCRERSIALAFTVSRLRREWPAGPVPKISTVLPDDLDLSEHVRLALRCRNPSDLEGVNSIGEYSSFAYAAPLVAAMIDDRDWVLPRENAHDIFHKFKHDSEVQRLIDDPRFGSLQDAILDLPQKSH